MSRQFPIVRHEVYNRGTSSEKWTTTVTHEVSTSSVPKIEKVSREARRGFSTTDDPEQAFVWLNYELTSRRYVDSIAVAALRTGIGRGQSLVRVIGRPGEDPRAVEASIMDIDGWKLGRPEDLPLEFDSEDDWRPPVPR